LPSSTRATAGPLSVSLIAKPADGGNVFGPSITISGGITGQLPAGTRWLWLCSRADPKPGETTPALFYAKDPISGLTFNFVGLPFGGGYQDAYSVGRTWQVFVVSVQTDSAERWMEEANAYSKDYSFPGGNRLDLPPGAYIIGSPISVTRGT
jgi:hypothetical protein